VVSGNVRLGVDEFRMNKKETLVKRQKTFQKKPRNAPKKPKKGGRPEERRGGLTSPQGEEKGQGVFEKGPLWGAPRASETTKTKDCGGSFSEVAEAPS